MFGMIFAQGHSCLPAFVRVAAWRACVPCLRMFKLWGTEWRPHSPRAAWCVLSHEFRSTAPPPRRSSLFVWGWGCSQHRRSIRGAGTYPAPSPLHRCRDTKGENTPREAGEASLPPRTAPSLKACASVTADDISTVALAAALWWWSVQPFQIFTVVADTSLEVCASGARLMVSLKAGRSDLDITKPVQPRDLDKAGCTGQSPWDGFSSWRPSLSSTEHRGKE